MVYASSSAYPGHQARQATADMAELQKTDVQQFFTEVTPELAAQLTIDLDSADEVEKIDDKMAPYIARRKKRAREADLISAQQTIERMKCEAYMKRSAGVSDGLHLLCDVALEEPSKEPHEETKKPAPIPKIPTAPQQHRSPIICGGAPVLPTYFSFLSPVCLHNRFDALRPRF
ncbi:MAG: hypothetical protein ACHQVS_04835 [Candidatus Babeliales bacterium]